MIIQILAVSQRCDDSFLFLKLKKRESIITKWPKLHFKGQYIPAELILLVIFSTFKLTVHQKI